MLKDGIRRAWVNIMVEESDGMMLNMCTAMLVNWKP